MDDSLDGPTEEQFAEHAKLLLQLRKTVWKPGMTARELRDAMLEDSRQSNAHKEAKALMERFIERDEAKMAAINAFLVGFLDGMINGAAIVESQAQRRRVTAGVNSSKMTDDQKRDAQEFVNEKCRSGMLFSNACKRAYLELQTPIKPRRLMDVLEDPTLVGPK